MIETSLVIQGKAEIIDAAKAAILAGHSTLSDIAKQHGISRRTLQYWLAELGDEYKMLRQAWIDNILVDAGEEIEKVGEVSLEEPTNILLTQRLLAAEQLRLARARELWRRASWYAERRDPERYGQKQDGIGTQIIVNISREKTTTSSVSEGQHQDIPLIVETPSLEDTSTTSMSSDPSES